MADPIAARLLGTWKMISAVREEKPSGVKTDLFGPNPVGFLNYSADGRMLTLIVRGDRKRPAGYPISQEQAAGLFRGPDELRRNLGDQGRRSIPSRGRFRERTLDRQRAAAVFQVRRRCVLFALHARQCRPDRWKNQRPQHDVAKSDMISAQTASV